MSMITNEKILIRQRRFPSAYVFYSLKKQTQIFKETNGAISIDEIGRRISTSWLKMTAGEKAVWLKRAEKHRSTIISQSSRQTLEDMDGDAMEKNDRKSLKNSGSGLKKRGRGRTKKRRQKRAYSKLPRDPRRPKRPITAYLFFAQQMRPKIKEKNPELKGLDITRKVGVAWNETSMAEKEPFMKLEADSRRVYKEAMMMWRQNLMEDPTAGHSAYEDEKEILQDTKDDLLDDNDEDDDEDDEDGDDEDDDDNNDEEEEEDDDDVMEEEHEVEIDQSENGNDTNEIQNNNSSSSTEKVVQNDSSVDETKCKKSEQIDLESKGVSKKDEDKNNEVEITSDDKSSNSHPTEKGVNLKNASPSSSSSSSTNSNNSGKAAKQVEYDSKTASPEPPQNFFPDAMMNSQEVQHRLFFHGRLPNGAPYVGSNPVPMPHVMPPMPGAIPFPQIPVVPNYFSMDQGQAVPHVINPPPPLPPPYFRRQQNEK